MRRARWSLFVLLLVPLLVVSGWAPSDAVESWRLYDDFEVGPISPTKWSGWSDEDRFIREMNRTIVVDPSGVGRDLRLMLKAWGDTIDNTGEVLTQVGMTFAQPSMVTAMRARVNVRSYSVKSCTANVSSTADANVAIIGSFFNVDQAAKTPGDFTGDVRAVVAVGASTGSFNDAGAHLYVFGMVFQCNDSTCSWQNRTNLVPSGSPTTDMFFLGTPVALGSWVRISVQWDEANQQFLFQRGTQTPVAVSYASLTPPNPGSPAVVEKNIVTVNNVPNCMPPNAPGTAKMDVLIDAVAVNQNALP